MNQHPPRSRHPRSNHQGPPNGRGGLIALKVALELVAILHQLQFPRGLGHLRDHLIRAADNTALRLSEASGRTMGNRTQHLEGAFAETQEVQTALALMVARGVSIPRGVLQKADRLGGLVYGLLRADRAPR